MEEAARTMIIKEVGYDFQKGDRGTFGFDMDWVENERKEKGKGVVLQTLRCKELSLLSGGGKPHFHRADKVRKSPVFPHTYHFTESVSGTTPLSCCYQHRCPALFFYFVLFVVVVLFLPRNACGPLKNLEVFFLPRSEKAVFDMDRDTFLSIA
ncbi:hypothetical protein SLEP1_g39088 [Rubroshorea leprosula]|uniref:Uncharacterized protein n=1 Tax=Rubroshorea leprosula TaxID=152421 RepID=A0AAV5KZ42_9ROSI|nr:hypothetical protein SLEP1_g39088 [Rubroshorea leprosula]